MSYNNSAKTLWERITKMPSEESHNQPGRAKSLHPTKGYRRTRIDPTGNRKLTIAEKMYRHWGKGGLAL